MSLYYGLGGLGSFLTVVGLCMAFPLMGCGPLPDSQFTFDAADVVT